MGHGVADSTKQHQQSIGIALIILRFMLQARVYRIYVEVWVVGIGCLVLAMLAVESITLGLAEG